MRFLKYSLFLVALFLVTNRSRAQVAPASIGARPALYAGGYYSDFDSDLFNPQPRPPRGPSTSRITGVGVFADWDLFGRLGAEGEARFLRLNQRNSFHSDHYLLGPRYFLRRGKFRPYAKFLMGVGEVNYPYSLAHGGYFAMAPGGGLDYQLTRRFDARADYEYQFWPKAPGLPGAPSHGLTPNGFSVGVRYRIF